MLTKLTVNDFQSHRHTEIDLHQNYNVIVGQSGCGKTAVLRALKLLLYNKPNGVTFVRRPDATEAKVVLQTDTDTLERIKGPKVNEYIVNGSVFKDFGTNVPEDVLKLLPIKDVVFDENLSFNIQFAEQFDSPFLLLESSANKAKFLNKLSGTYILNLLIKDFNDDSRSLKSGNKVYTEELDLRNSDIDKYSLIVENLTNATKYLNDQVELYESKQKQYNDIVKLNSFTDSVIKKQKAINLNKIIYSRISAEAWINSIDIYNNIYSIAYALKDIEFNLKLIDKKKSAYSKIDFNAIDKIEQYNNLYKYLGVVTNLRDAYISFKQDKDLLAKVDYSVNTKVDYFNSIYNIANLVNANAKTLGMVQRGIASYSQDIAEIKTAYREVLMTKSNCPTCGASITPQQISNYIASL